MTGSSWTHKRPALFVSVYEQESGVWVAWGSRTGNYLEINAEFDEFRTLMDEYSRTLLREYEIRGSFLSITYTTAQSKLAALGALLDVFQKEEDEENRQKFEAEKRNADLERFGGEVNEELIRKVVRWRKKQEKKTAKKEGRWCIDCERPVGRCQCEDYDPDGEWDF